MPNGRRMVSIALVDSGSSSILVYDFKLQKTFLVPSQAGSSGSLSPDGTRLVYPDTVFDQNGGARTTLHSIVIDTGDTSLISDPNTQDNDQVAEWSPDGRQIAIARQDDKMAHGAQIALLNLLTNKTSFVTNDPRYSNMTFWWDPTGTELAIYRFPELDADLKPDPLARPEVWTLAVNSGTLLKVATDAFTPQWVP